MYTLKSDYKADADDMIHMKRQQLDSITTCNRVIAFLIWLAVAVMLFGAFESICFSKEFTEIRDFRSNEEVVIGTREASICFSEEKPKEVYNLGSIPFPTFDHAVDNRFTNSACLQQIIFVTNKFIMMPGRVIVSSKMMTEAEKAYKEVNGKTGMNPLHLLWIIPLSIIAGIILMIWFILTRMDVDDRKEVKSINL